MDYNMGTMTTAALARESFIRIVEGLQDGESVDIEYWLDACCMVTATITTAQREGDRYALSGQLALPRRREDDDYVDLDEAWGDSVAEALEEVMGIGAGMCPRCWD